MLNRSRSGRADMGVRKDVAPALAQKGSPPLLDLEDDEFWSLVERCSPISLLTAEKFYNLYTALHYICDNDIEGDIIECGVWKGGAMLMAAEVLAARRVLDRDIYLYDTYSGFVERSDCDVAYDGREIGKVSYPDFIDQVRKNFNDSSYTRQRIHFVQGDVHETVRADRHQRIALLRLDTDTYSSTLHELRELYDRVETGGVLIIDDYGYSRGCRRAVEEFFATRKRPFLQRPNKGCRTAIKTESRTNTEA